MRVSEIFLVEALAIRNFGEVSIELQPKALAEPANRKVAALRVQFATRTVDALLIYLACHKGAVGREALAELLWPERTQKQARSNLRVALYRLRQQLGPYLLITRDSIAINPESTIFLDVAQFEAHLAAGRLQAAVDLYAGDFLDGFYLDGSPAFEQWALLERERLRTLVLAALQQLSLQSAAGHEAIANTQRLLQLDPLHEPTHRHLMRLLAEAGLRSAALAQYELCCQLLSTELEVLPDTATTDLYEQIRSIESRGVAEVALRRESGEQSGANEKSATVARHNLPSQPTPFIGRVTQLAQIERLLTNPDCRLLTLVGVGGVGKTRLALEGASRQAASFVDGLYFVNLAPIAKPEFVAVAIAQSLGLQVAGGDIAEEIAANLQPRQLLLILDNFEHLLAAADFVAYLLQAAPHVKALVTSRERLYLREEWLLPLTGLATAEGLLGEAEELFIHSVQRLHPDFSSIGQEEAISAICAQVEGMPLALELAASWAQVMSCAEIAQRIEESLDFLTTEIRNLPQRHRSLRALFDQSWILLSPLEQGVLMRLSVFAGGWTVEEGGLVTGATRTLLRGLVDKSLVRASGQGRFDLHELVRQYAAEKLVSSGEADMVRERHFTTYLKLAVSGDQPLRGPDTALWLARLQPEQDNLRAALQWMFDEGRYEEMAWLLVALLWFWHQVGNWYEFGKWLAKVLPHRHRFNPDLHLALLLTLLSVARSVEEFLPVDRWTAEAMSMLAQCPYRLLHAGLWHFVAAYSSDLLQSSSAWERSIELARISSDGPRLGPEFGITSDRDFVLGVSMQSYATRLIEHGELVRAAILSQESLKHFQARGSQYEIVQSLGNLGYIAMLQGDLVQAYLLLHKAVTLAATFNYHEGIADLQPLLGIVTLDRGDAVEARRLLKESQRVCIDLKDNILIARNCTYLAEVALWEGGVEEAAQWLGQSLTHYMDWRSTNIQEVRRLFVAARLVAAQQRYSLAATLFGLAEQLNSHIQGIYSGQVRLLADQALAAVRSAMSAESFAEAFAAGQQLSLDKAFHTILTPAALMDTGEDLPLVP